MQWLIDNWSLLVLLVVVAIVAMVEVKKYLASTDDEKKERLKNAVSDWLLRAVTEAEKDLGSGTGKLKIRAVYERALEVFGSSLAEVISLEELDNMAQKPLKEMRKMLEGNTAMAKYVNNEG